MYATLTDIKPTVLNCLFQEHLDMQGRIKNLSAARYRGIQQEDAFRLWCNFHQLYVIPTEGLIGWLQSCISGYDKKDVLEIGAGRSRIGEFLGIRQTDVYMCDNEEAKPMYALLGGEAPRPLDGVEKMEASEAVKTYNPKVVIAGWVSQWVDRNDPNPSPGSIFGVKKEDVIDHPSVETYIQISHDDIHGHERVMARKPTIIRPDWVVSRRPNPGNAIYIWGEKWGIGAPDTAVSAFT